jgi:GT2 family glycosyltransferase
VISIVIPTLRARPDLLDECLTAVTETAPDAEVLVVDEGLPFAEHCNRGFDKATGELVVFLNDDTVVHDGWLENLTRPFADLRVGITGCRLLYADGRIQHAGIYFDSPDGVLTAHNMLLDAQSRYVEAVTGACMAVRRQTFQDLGGFDAGFVNGYEDVDFCLRARGEGWRIWYERDAVVTHHESASGAARWTHVGHNIRRLQEKWG